MLKMAICKGLFFGICLFFGIAAVCFIILTITVLIYGDPKSVTDDPTDHRLETGNANYMEPAAYKKYRLVYEKVGYICFLTGLIGLVFWGIRWYIVQKSNG
jgi:hypothetical protein